MCVCMCPFVVSLFIVFLFMFRIWEFLKGGTEYGIRNTEYGIRNKMLMKMAALRRFIPCLCIILFSAD